MVFLHEKYIAAFFGLTAFLISLVTSIMHGTTALNAITRALAFGCIAFFAGIIFGIVIRNLFAETIIYWKQKEDEERARLKKEREEARRKRESEEDGADDEEYTPRIRSPH